MVSVSIVFIFADTIAQIKLLHVIISIVYLNYIIVGNQDKKFVTLQLISIIFKSSIMTAEML